MYSGGITYQSPVMNSPKNLYWSNTSFTADDQISSRRP